MKYLRHVLCLAPAFGLAGVACGGNGLSGSTDRPSAIATIHGEIDNPTHLSLDASAFRVAIVWVEIPGDGGSTALRAAGDIAVTPQFPSQFRLDLTALPPPEAISLIPDTSIKMAGGAIVAYEDGNHNGKLDLIDPHATTSIDRVLSVPTDTSIVYLEGDLSSPDLADDDGAAPTPGFQFIQLDPLGQWACTGGPIIAGMLPPSCPGLRWQPITTPLTLSVSTSPELSIYLCGSWGGGSIDARVLTPGDLSDFPGDLSDFNGHLPVKSDPKLLCQADGSRFTYTTCAALAGGSLCDLKYTCTSKTYAFDASRSAEWPCPRN